MYRYLNSLLSTLAHDLIHKKKPEKKRTRSSVTKLLLYTCGIITIIVGVQVLVIAVLIYTQSLIHAHSINPQYKSSIEIPLYPKLTNKQLDISAKSAIVFEKDSRVVVYEKEANYRFSPASTTKIMSLLVALEQYNLEDYVHVPENIRTIEGSAMGLYGGEEMRVQDLLYGLMLPSGNDAAYVLSMLDAKGKEGFVQKMNQKAYRLKLYNTRFFDPSGYEDANYTSAFDLARLAAYALDNKNFREIVSTRAITVYDRYHTHVYHLENLNKLLSNSDVFGIKTGFTNEAGEVLVTSLENKGRTYIIVVMKSGDRFGDTEEIMNKIRTAVELVRY